MGARWRGEGSQPMALAQSAKQAVKKQVVDGESAERGGVPVVVDH